MRRIWSQVILLAMVSLFNVPRAHAQSAGPTRAEIPIREVTLSDGARRYAVPITVGAAEILAGLDTGSTGLRILPGVLPDGAARPTGQSDSYSYGSGAKFDGAVAKAAVSVGGLRGDAAVQLIERVGCTDEKPRCAAGAIAPARYGIQGDGLPGEGFKAILGVNMADADAANVFKAVGARRWIVELPRPGEPGEGRLVLNPTDAEVQGFVSLPILDRFSDRRGGAHDAVAGCLINDASHAKLCGAVVLDTGAPGLEVIGADIARSPWPNETPATLVFTDADGRPRAAERLVIGRRDHASHLSFVQRDRVPLTLILSGLTPYFAYAVLYDPAHGTVGLKPRPPTAGGPTPVAID